MAKMRHLDLFSGIGGFALAVESVWLNSEHIFCEIDPFCQQVLKKHFPNSHIHADIKTFKANDIGRIDLLTGGFPCQPFSQAGKQRGKEDDRYLWPEMLRVIKESKPTWIVGENVAGIVNMALEQACVDLENQGYEVQPIIIPACAVNAPHRRDRVWIVAYNAERTHGKHNGREEVGQKQELGESSCCCVTPNARCEYGQQRRGQGFEPTEAERSPQAEKTERHGEVGDAPNPCSTRLEGGQQDQAPGYNRLSCGEWSEKGYDWNSDWPEVAADLCGMDDGLPVELDGFKLTKAKHRAERLKALGNAIVPQVAVEIMKAINSNPIS